MLDLAEEGQMTETLRTIPAKNEVELYFYNIYQDLSLSRQTGESVGCVPASEVKAYIDLFELHDDDRLIFKIVHDLDLHYIKVITALRKQESEGGENGG